MRDFQRTRVYRAEDSIDRGKRMENIREIQTWVNRMQRSKFWLKNFPRWPITVYDGRGRRRAGGGFGFIKMPKHSRTQLIVLHELAHAVTADKHGPRFCDAYLKLVARFMGKHKAEELRVAFVKHNVTYYAP